jgi:hypothetical protein
MDYPYAEPSQALIAMMTDLPVIGTFHPRIAVGGSADSSTTFPTRWGSHPWPL